MSRLTDGMTSDDLPDEIKESFREAKLGAERIGYGYKLKRDRQRTSQSNQPNQPNSSNQSTYRFSQSNIYNKPTKKRVNYWFDTDGPLIKFAGSLAALYLAFHFMGNTKLYGILWAPFFVITVVMGYSSVMSMYKLYKTNTTQLLAPLTMLILAIYVAMH